MGDKETLKQWIKKQRLENYGYEPSYFRKMQSHKARVFKKLDKVPEQEVAKALAKAGILGKGRRLSKVRTRKGTRVLMRN